MNINSQIKALLYEHNCVIVPGFGGFVAEYRPARIHPGNNEFSPPAKSIAFNPRLDRNDGVLINGLVKSASIPYQEAEQQIKTFAEQCKNKLQQDRSLRFEGIGKLVLEDEGLIRFVPEDSLNFLEEAFSLPVFKADPIERSKEEAIEKKKQEHKKLKIKPEVTEPVATPVGESWSSANWWLAAAVILAILGAVQFLVMTDKLSISDGIAWNSNTTKPVISEARMFPVEPLIPSLQQQMNNYGSVTPLSERVLTATLEPEVKTEEAEVNKSEKETEQVLAKLDPKIPEKSKNRSSAGPLPAAKPSRSAKADVAPTSIPATVKSSISYSHDPANRPVRGYYIVIGSFSSENMARKRLTDELGNSADGSAVLRRNGKFRASVFVSKSEMEVWNQLSSLRDNYSQPDAWILKY